MAREKGRRPGYWLDLPVDLVAIRLYTGDDANNRVIDLGFIADAVVVVLGTSKSNTDNHMVSAYALRTYYGASYDRAGADDVTHYTMASANPYFQGLMSGADASKVKLGSSGATLYGPNVATWLYAILAFRFRRARS